MDEVRVEIDRIDRACTALLAERWGYVDRAWQLKAGPGAGPDVVNIKWRNDEVIEKVREVAEEDGLPPELAESLWRVIINWSIHHQKERLKERLRDQG